MSYYMDQLLTREQRESCAKYDAEQRFSELVATHRAGFCAVQPQPAEACAELGYEDAIAELEGDPWIYWAVVAGVIGGMLLSVPGVL